MIRRPRQNSAAERDAFDATCRRLAGFDGRVDPEWVDGFLAAVAAGPAPAPSDEWLPALLGDDTFERVFADPADHAQAVQSLAARLAVLRDQLDPEALDADPGTLRLDPWLYQSEDQSEGPSEGDSPLRDAELWAEGFLHGVGHLPPWQETVPEDAVEPVTDALKQLAALHLDDDSEPMREHIARYWRGKTPSRDELVVEALAAVQDLRLSWIDFAPRPPPRRVEPVPGRNDPCPCGSGKKYKRCHGATA